MRLSGNVPNVPVIIPAYRPGVALIALVHELLALDVAHIVVVDDGSGPEFGECFQRIELPGRVHLTRHAVNLGKGAALKTGMNYVLNHFSGCVGVITADADGQHHPQDIVQIMTRMPEAPGSLVLGTRAFDEKTPLRSRLGNAVTRVLMRFVVGQNLADTQTGLRGIPADLIPHLLRLQPSGYEFELEMLIACKHKGYHIVQHPIQTIYLDNNKSSHFRPIFDSMRIYFVLFRFSVLAVVTAILDNIIFAIVFSSTGSVAKAQITARLVAMVFNYAGASSLVFHSEQRQVHVLPKYIVLVAGNGLVSYGLIQLINDSLGSGEIPAKLLAEGLLFIANFSIQRDFVFTRRTATNSATDWDQYYSSVPPTAKITRRYTTAVLLDAIKRYVTGGAGASKFTTVEIGGANSCFLEGILANTDCSTYEVIDTNEYGLSLLAQRYGDNPSVRLHCKSVLDLTVGGQADLVFSVGLVEHFGTEDTKKAVLAHFDLARSGGIVLITFPTPTTLYRVARGFLESIGLWNFPDERPLLADEVITAMGSRGTVVFRKTLWPLILTQELIVARKETDICIEANDGRE